MNDWSVSTYRGGLVRVALFSLFLLLIFLSLSHTLSSFSLSLTLLLSLSPCYEQTGAGNQGRSARIALRSVRFRSSSSSSSSSPSTVSRCGHREHAYTSRAAVRSLSAGRTRSRPVLLHATARARAIRWDVYGALVLATRSRPRLCDPSRTKDRPTLRPNVYTEGIG